MAKVGLKDIKIHAYHGIFVQEAVLGNDFLINLEVDVPISKASLSDQLSDTVDYSLLYQIACAEMRIRSMLLEHVASRIIKAIHRKCGKIPVKITISKLNPFLGYKSSSSFIEMTDQDL